jgi:hypothetical protein
MIGQLTIHSSRRSLAARLNSGASQSRAMRGGYQRGYNVSTSVGCGLGSGEAGQNWQLARDPPRKAAA